MTGGSACKTRRHIAVIIVQNLETSMMAGVWACHPLISKSEDLLACQLARKQWLSPLGAHTQGVGCPLSLEAQLTESAQCTAPLKSLS